MATVAATTVTPTKIPVRTSRLLVSLSILEPIESGRNRVMGNDPLVVERNRDADCVNRTWTRGRTSFRSIRRRGNEVNPIFWAATGHRLPGAARATGWRGRASV